MGRDRQRCRKGRPPAALDRLIFTYTLYLYVYILYLRVGLLQLILHPLQLGDHAVKRRKVRVLHGLLRLTLEPYGAVLLVEPEI